MEFGSKHIVYFIQWLRAALKDERDKKKHSKSKMKKMEISQYQLNKGKANKMAYG